MSKVEKMTQREVVIPYNHQHLTANCDFIFKTAQELIQRGACIHFILRLHETNILAHMLNISTSLQELENTIKSNFDQKYHDRIFVHQQVTLFPKIFTKISGRAVQVNAFVGKHFCSHLVRSLHHPVLWSFDHQNFDLFELTSLQNITKFYDCVDYYSSPLRDANEIIASQELRQARAATHIFVNSHVLQRKFTEFSNKLTCVPQGFDSGTFSKPAVESIYSKEIKKRSGKKIAIVANLTYRFDFQLLNEVVRKSKDYTFIISSTRLRCEVKLIVFCAKTLSLLVS